ncbi:MAG: SLC13/DASS family transporter, partial [Christensenellaceae bacterium]|nr:SLC13/DASS family transporter [Christensenellaceae bacterium]
AFAGFADSTVILFAAMFVLGAALFQTGLARKIGLFVVKLFSGSETKLMVGVMVLTACMAAFLSNTGTVAILLPIVMEIADSQGWSRAKLLLPMAYISSAAGTCTMTGTPPNLTVNAVLSNYGFEPLGFFDYAWYGIPMTIVAIIYLSTIGKKLIPNRGAVETAASAAADEKVYDKKKQIIAGSTLVAVVIMMVWGIADLAIVASAGALLCVLTGCLSEKQAYQAIDWSTIFLFAGALSLANAMATTGAGSMIANICVNLMGGNPSPYLVLTVLFFVTDILTEFMSNTASAALLCPIGLEIAAILDVSPIAIVLSIGFAASAAYITPISTPPNTLVWKPANLRFTDYSKVGAPLFFLAYVVAVLIVPLVWPF